MLSTRTVAHRLPRDSKNVELSTQKAEVFSSRLLFSGDGGIRTLDPQIANLMLSQLSYVPGDADYNLACRQSQEIFSASRQRRAGFIATEKFFADKNSNLVGEFFFQARHRISRNALFRARESESFFSLSLHAHRVEFNVENFREPLTH